MQLHSRNAALERGHHQLLVLLLVKSISAEAMHTVTQETGTTSGSLPFHVG